MVCPVGRLAACRAEGKKGSRPKGNAKAVNSAGLPETWRRHSSLEFLCFSKMTVDMVWVWRARDFSWT